MQFDYPRIEWHLFRVTMRTPGMRHRCRSHLIRRSRCETWNTAIWFTSESVAPGNIIMFATDERNRTQNVWWTQALPCVRIYEPINTFILLLLLLFFIPSFFFFVLCQVPLTLVITAASALWSDSGRNSCSVHRIPGCFAAPPPNTFTTLYFLIEYILWGDTDETLKYWRARAHTHIYLSYCIK